MKITMIGAGYVGLVSAACLADVGNDVVCFDTDRRKIDTLNQGRIPIHEPGLFEVVQRNVAAGRLHFTSEVAGAVLHGTMLFIAVGTPPDEDGSADTSCVIEAARSIGRHMTDYKLVVSKSTVPVGTSERVHAAIEQELRDRDVQVPYEVISNPEFLKEGAAIEDFLRPDRIIVGSNDPRATMLMKALFAPFQRNHDRMILMDPRSAELTKYAANAMLATRISFMNELANLAEKLGADIEMVRQGIGSDPRIGYQFLYPGCGYGGSCFPKDVRALLRTGASHGQPLKVLAAVEETNEAQKSILARKVFARFGTDLNGRRFGLWGLAFKPNTDDMREAPSRRIVEELTGAGATVVAYDPVAIPAARRVFNAQPYLEYADDALSACREADALLVATEWKSFYAPDLEAMRSSMRSPIVFDGRNIYDPALMRELGFEYHAIGRPVAAEEAVR